MSYLVLTFAFRNSDDITSLRQREESTDWESNCSIRRLFTWEPVSLRSSSSLSTLPDINSFYIRRTWCVCVSHNQEYEMMPTTMSNIICQIPTSLNWGCFIKHVRNIFFIPQALGYLCQKQQNFDMFNNQYAANQLVI